MSNEQIQIIWTLEDVVRVALDNDLTIVYAEALQILRNLEKNHNAEIGISWETIREEIKTTSTYTKDTICPYFFKDIIKLCRKHNEKDLMENFIGQYAEINSYDRGGRMYYGELIQALYFQPKYMLTEEVDKIFEMFIAESYIDDNSEKETNRIVEIIKEIKWEDK